MTNGLMRNIITVLEIDSLLFKRNGQMKWCNLMMMWRSDLDDEDLENCICDGDCSDCYYCEDVKPRESEEKA